MTRSIWIALLASLALLSLALLYGRSDTSAPKSAGAPPSAGPCGSSAFKWTGAASRPQLSDGSAPCYTVRRYLGDWDPSAGLPPAATLKPHFRVALDGSGTHTSVQAAASAATGSARVYILVEPGTYRELVCVSGTTPITLYGADADATRVGIAYDNYNAKPVDGAQVNPCAPVSGATFGTTPSSTFFVKSNDFQAMNLTISNDYAEPDGGTAQAVAMTTEGDRLVFQNVRFIGNQDTLQPSSPSESAVARAYYKSSYIEGDTDFIFGRGTAVFDACDISYVGTRKTGGAHLAPSTDGSSPYGFLVINSHIIGGAGTKPFSTTLGRAWNMTKATNPNGQAVIRDTLIDSHVHTAAPWADSTGGSRKPFDANTNRMFEYNNTGPGAK